MGIDLISVVSVFMAAKTSGYRRRSATGFRLG
jgi:hypothetical protein